MKMQRNMKTSIVLLILVIFCFVSCFDPPVQEELVKIGFYFLKDSTLTNMDSLDGVIEDLELADEPWLSEADIDFYEWSGHYIYLNKTKQELLPDFFGGDSSISIPRPFVVTVDSTRLYLACIKTFFGGWGNYYPSITEIELYGYIKDMVSFSYIPIHSPDLRDNDILKSALQENDQYRGGLEIEIDTSYGAHFTQANDSISISYRLTYQNHNEDALYVLDPEKCGNDVFYYLFGYPALAGTETNCSWPLNLSFSPASMPDTSEYGDLRFYSRIPAGDTLSIPLTIKGESLEPDTYIMWNYVGSFIESMDHEKRTKSDGRIWVGWTWMPPCYLSYTGGDTGTITEIDFASLLGKPVVHKPFMPFVHIP